MKVFLTGSTGFIGGHVAREFAAQGAELRLLVRKTSRLDNLQDLKAETVIGDLREPEGLRTAISGCEIVAHVAADYRLWVRDPDAMIAANVNGTRDLLRLAREQGVRRLVYTSSVATMGFKSDGTIVDEQTPVDLKDMIGHYKRSKYLAEQEALAAAANWTQRFETDADGADRCGFSESQVSCIYGYGAQPGRCDRGGACPCCGD
jgi:dihydroflavonol-4-reductase